MDNYEEYAQLLLEKVERGYIPEERFAFLMDKLMEWDLQSLEDETHPSEMAEQLDFIQRILSSATSHPQAALHWE